MSDQISIIGIKAFGYHGVLPHEAVEGQEFIVDLLITLDLQAASRSDDLTDTVNYAELVQIVHKNIVGERVQLIERLAGRIADAVAFGIGGGDQTQFAVQNPQHVGEVGGPVCVA